MRYGRVWIGEDEFHGHDVTLSVPMEGVRHALLSSWGEINLFVSVPDGAQGKIVAALNDNPSMVFELDIEGHYRVQDGLLLLPFVAYAELQKGFNTLLGLAVDTRKQLNMHRGQPENEGLEFLIEPEGTSEP